MIYEETEIIDLLKCENCFEAYDEYYPPRILPCCEKTICYKCVQKTDKQVKNNKFRCILCNKEELLPNNGFMVNQLAVKFLAKKPKEISRGKEAERLKKTLYDLENLVGKLLFEMDNGEYLITEDCKELRRQVQLAREEKIEEINQKCDALFIKIDSHEEYCKSKYKESKKSKLKANELIELVNESIQKQHAYLRQLTIDDKDTIAFNKNMDELKVRIEIERKNLKKTMFGNQIMKFKANKSSISEEFIGNLIQDAMDFSVIFFSIKLF